MLSVIDNMNLLLNGAFSLLVFPFRGLAPVWPLTFVSLVTGLLMLWIFGLVSNQEAIIRVKDKIRGNLLAIRLYQHDVGIVLKSQARIFRDTLTYMKYSLYPMAVLIVPVVLIIIQLHLNFAAEPLTPGKSILLKVKVRDAELLKGVPELEVPEGVEVETPGVRIPGESEVDWRVRATKVGHYSLTVKLGAETVDKNLVSGSGWEAVSTRRTGSNAWDLLLYPGESHIPATSPVESIDLNYPPLPVSVLGWNINWLVLFFILSIVFGFAFKGFFGIEV